MTILVSSVGDTIISMLQEKTGRQAEDDRLMDGATEGHPTAREIQHTYVPGSNRVLFNPGTQSRAGTVLANLVQNKFPRDLVMLSGKLIK